MFPEYLIKGFIAGAAIAAPVGPTTVLVVHRTVKQKLSGGIRSGLGAAMADAAFGLLAAFGVGFVAALINSHKFFIHLVGGAFLLFWGGRIFLSRFAEKHPLVKGEGWGGPFWSTFVLTLTNPMTLLAFMAILAGIGGAKIDSHFRFVFEWMVGICLGSFGWWLLFAFIIHGLREKFDFKALRAVNRITGLIVAAAGILVLISLK